LQTNTSTTSLFGPEFIQQFLVAAKPALESLIRDVLEDARSSPQTLCVPYEEAGRMIGTSYEGIRKLVRNGILTPTSRGRRRVIAINELKAYTERCKVRKQ
jgi:hypothetical protein